MTKHPFCSGQRICHVVCVCSGRWKPRNCHLPNTASCPPPWADVVCLFRAPFTVNWCNRPPWTLFALFRRSLRCPRDGIRHFPHIQECVFFCFCFPTLSDLGYSSRRGSRVFQWCCCLRNRSHALCHWTLRFGQCCPVLSCRSQSTLNGQHTTKQ